MTDQATVHLVNDSGHGTVCGSTDPPPSENAVVHLCQECNDIALGRKPTPPDPELTEAESLGLLVGAALGKAMAERDQAVQFLQAVIRDSPPTSFAHTNATIESAQAWLEEYDAARAVGSPETPEQETTGP